MIQQPESGTEPLTPYWFLNFLQYYFLFRWPQRKTTPGEKRIDSGLISLSLAAQSELLN